MREIIIVSVTAIASYFLGKKVKEIEIERNSLKNTLKEGEVLDEIKSKIDDVVNDDVSFNKLLRKYTKGASNLLHGVQANLSNREGSSDNRKESAKESDS